MCLLAVLNNLAEFMAEDLGTGNHTKFQKARYLGSELALFTA